MRAHIYTQRVLSPPQRELPRHGITSLEDSHLPNCVPVFILRRDLFRLRDACIRNCAASWIDLLCRQMIAIVVYSESTTYTPHADVTDDYDMTEIIQSSVNQVAEIFTRD